MRLRYRSSRGACALAGRALRGRAAHDALDRRARRATRSASRRARRASCGASVLGTGRSASARARHRSPRPPLSTRPASKLEPCRRAPRPRSARRSSSFFEQRDHSRMPSASLVPSVLRPVGAADHRRHAAASSPTSSGQEQPPHPRLTSCQKCFRTTDIDQVGLTARHLTFFEMLGNFSFGDYFKQGAVEFAWELSTEGFGLDPERIWITVFEGDEELGLGPDEEAIECWRSVGVPDERIVRLPRSENFWQAGPVGPVRPVLGALLRPRARLRRRRRPPRRRHRALPRVLEPRLHAVLARARTARSTPLPKRTSTPALGLERLAAILQDVPSVFENDQFRPLVELGEQLSGRRYGDDPATTRALRVLADHSRAMTFLIADGVVPSNEDRGYILRRVMRRAIQQGRSIGLESPFLGALRRPRDRDDGRRLPRARGRARRRSTSGSTSEEESFGRTLEQGTRLLAELVERAKADGHVVDLRRGRVQASRHLRLPLRPDAGAARTRRGCRSTTRASTS